MTNINKPFYKKVLTITIAGLIATTVVGCSNNKSKNSNNTQTTQKVNKTNSKKKSSKITSQKNALRKNYNKIFMKNYINQAL